MRLIDILLAENAVPAYVRDIPKFNVTNVADYYYGHKKEFWGLHEFPFPMPPYDKLWVEYTSPREIYSDELGKTETMLPPGFSCHFGAQIYRLPEPDWFQVKGAMYIVEKDAIWKKIKDIDFHFRLRSDEECITQLDMPMLHIEEERLLIEYMEKVTGRKPPRHPKEHPDSTHNDILAATRMYIMHPVLMAFSFMNCKNVEIVTVEIPEKLNKAREKRGKSKLQDFRVINVLPMNVHQKKTRIVKLGDKIQVALGSVKLRRGSYAKYGMKYNRGLLFGKYEGIYWRPAILRDTDSEKEYDVRVKEGEK